MYKVGITGCMGSGKSTISRLFAQLGIPVYNADNRAKELMVQSPPLIKGIKDLFGIEAYDADGLLNRSHISGQAFHDSGLLDNLNALVHPEVFRDFDDWCAKQDAPYLIKEAALMFESESYKHLDTVIVVTAPMELRITRAMKRDGLSREEVMARMQNQMSQEEKLARARYEIKNDEQHLLIPQVLELDKTFKANQTQENQHQD